MDPRQPGELKELRAGLEYGEEVHLSRFLGEWSNKIGYEMVFTNRGLHYGQDLSDEEHQAWMKN